MTSPDDAELSRKQSEELQVGNVFENDRRRDMWDVVVGAQFGVLYRGAEAVGRGEGPAGWFRGLYVRLA